MPTQPSHNRKWLLVGLLLLGGVFAVDVSFPLGVVTPFLYVVIAISAFFVSATDAIVLATVATVANVMAYALAPSLQIAEWMIAVGRAASVFATWLLIVTGIHFHKRNQMTIATIRESNERRRLALEEAERAQRERLTELQLLTDAIPMLIAYLDAQQRFQFVNAAYENAYDVPLDDIIGRTFEALVGDAAYARLQQHFDAVLRGTRVQFEEQLFRSDGVHWWLFQLLPRVNEQRQVIGFYSLVTDITGLKRSQEEVDRQREALAVFSRRGAANEMAAALAHEMNQPLSTVAVYSGRLVELLRQGKADPDDLLQAMELMHEEAIRAGQIIKRARAMVDDRPLQPALVDPTELLESAAKICSTRAAAAQVAIHLRVAPEAALIYADPVQLQQVLVNLVSNGIEAAQGLPQERRQVVVTASADEGGAQLAVVDAGRGMDTERLERVFEPHYTTKPDGLGIGLNIARSIVRTHGGTLSVTPNPEHGMTFHVTLPPAPPDRVFPERAENLPLLTKSV